MQKRRRVLSVGIALCILIGAVGCAEKKKEEPIEITLMHGWGGTLKTHNTMQGIYNEFSARNNDIVIKSMPYSDSSIAVEKANDMLAVGKMPDIISTNGLSYYVNNAVKREKAMDLMPYLNKDKEFAKSIHPAVYQTWTAQNGELYTIPDALEVAGYWYNESYLKQAGVVDGAGNVMIPQTWQAFLEMTEKLYMWAEETKQELSVFALDDVQMIESLFPARLAGTGGSGISAVSSSDSYIDPPALEETMTDLGALYDMADYVNNIENARQSFCVGKSIMYFNGVWESDALAESGLAKDFKYADYPLSEGSGLSYISPSSGYVLARQKDERKANACVRFLKYMMSEEVQLKIAVQTGQAPSNPNIDMTDVTKQYPLFGQALNTAYDAKVQLKMIRSVWSEQRIEVLRKYMHADLGDPEESRQMAEELNRLD